MLEILNLLDIKKEPPCFKFGSCTVGISLYKAVKLGRCAMDSFINSCLEVKQLRELSLNCNQLMLCDYYIVANIAYIA